MGVCVCMRYTRQKTVWILISKTIDKKEEEEEVCLDAHILALYNTSKSAFDDDDDDAMKSLTIYIYLYI